MSVVASWQRVVIPVRPRLTAALSSTDPTELPDHRHIEARYDMRTHTWEVRCPQGSVLIAGEAWGEYLSAMGAVPDERWPPRDGLPT